MLHALAHSQLLAQLESNVRDTARKMIAIDNPVLKETRTFWVEPFPVFFFWIITKLEQIMDKQLYRRLRDTYISRNVPSSDFSVENVIRFPDISSWISSPFLKTLLWIRGEEGTPRKFLTVKCSRKTMYRRLPMSTLISRQLSTLQTGTRIGTFRDFVQLEDDGFYQYAFNTVDLSTGLHPDIVRLVEISSGQLTGQDLVSAVRNYREGFEFNDPSKLHMKIKAYVGRADIRAYYVDTAVIRHMAGSVVQTFLMTPNIGIRSRLETERWLPARGKNILARHVKVQRGSHMRAMFGDISSFTNSDLNSWVYALSVYSWLVSLSEQPKPTTVCVDGVFVECNLLDVLLVYILTVVGSSSTLPDGSLYTAVGGYLGIKGNMSLTTMAFAIRLKYIEQYINDRYPGVLTDGQIGGDDFWLLLIGMNEEDVIAVEQYFTLAISTFVGRIKEPVTCVIDVSRLSDYTMGPTFCKKNVHCTVTPISMDETIVDFKSEQKLPLFSELVEIKRETTHRKQLTALRKFHLQVHRFFASYRQPEDLINAYLAVYLHEYHHPFSVRVAWSVKTIQPNLLMDWGHLLTVDVGKLVMRSPDLSNSIGEVVNGSLEDKLRSLMIGQRINLEKDERGLEAYYTDRDQKIFTRHLERLTISTYAHEYSSRVIGLFEFLRREVGHLVGQVDNDSSDSDVSP